MDSDSSDDGFNYGSENIDLLANHLENLSLEDTGPIEEFPIEELPIEELPIEELPIEELPIDTINLQQWESVTEFGLNYLTIYQMSARTANISSFINNQENRTRLECEENEAKFKRTFWPEAEMPLGASISWEDRFYPAIPLMDSYSNLPVDVPVVRLLSIRQIQSIIPMEISSIHLPCERAEFIPIYQPRSSSDVVTTIPPAGRNSNMLLTESGTYQSCESMDIGSEYEPTLSEFERNRNILMMEKGPFIRPLPLPYSCQSCEAMEVDSISQVNILSEVSMVTVSYFGGNRNIGMMRRNSSPYLPYTCLSCERMEVDSICNSTIVLDATMAPMSPMSYNYDVSHLIQRFDSNAEYSYVIEELYFRQTTGTSIESDYFETPSLFYLSLNQSDGSQSPNRYRDVATINSDDEDDSSFDDDYLDTEWAEEQEQSDDQLDHLCSQIVGLKFW